MTERRATGVTTHHSKKSNPSRVVVALYGETLFKSAQRAVWLSSLCRQGQSPSHTEVSKLRWLHERLAQLNILESDSVHRFHALLFFLRRIENLRDGDSSNDSEYRTNRILESTLHALGMHFRTDRFRIDCALLDLPVFFSLLS